MPAERVAMRHVREILRLKFAGVAIREIARRAGVAPSTVRATLARLQAAGLTWPLPEDMTDVRLEAELYKDSGARQGLRRHAEPDWAAVQRELKRKHVTLAVLWDEYIANHPDGYRYSRFCELYRAWEGKLPVTMRQTYQGGDKLFVDYAGDTVPVVVDRLTGETRPAQIFVAVMGASSFAYKKAGVILLDLVRPEDIPRDLFSPAPEAEARPQALMEALDGINRKLGPGAIRYGLPDPDASWQMKRGNKSPGYTTDWNELPMAKA